MPDLIIKPIATSGNKVKIQDQGAVTRLQTEDAGITIDNATVTTSFTSPGIDDNANATAITIDSNEGVGIRATPESWGSVYANLQIGSSATLSGRTNEDTVMINNNAYMDGTEWKRQGNNGSNESSQILLDNDGNVLLRTAGSDAADSAITWSTRAKIQQSGSALDVQKSWNDSDMSASVAVARFYITDGAGSANDFIHFTMGSGTSCGGIERSSATTTPVFFAGSDRRIKNNIKDVNDVLDKVNEVRIISADINTIENGKLEFGVIAQELNEVFPNLVKASDDGKGDELPEGVNAWTVADDWSYILIKAIQELSAKNDALEAENTTLKNRMDALEARVTALET